MYHFGRFAGGSLPTDWNSREWSSSDGLKCRP